MQGGRQGRHEESKEVRKGGRAECVEDFQNACSLSLNARTRAHTQVYVKIHKLIFNLLSSR